MTKIHSNQIRILIISKLFKEIKWSVDRTNIVRTAGPEPILGERERERERDLHIGIEWLQLKQSTNKGNYFSLSFQSRRII